VNDGTWRRGLDPATASANKRQPEDGWNGQRVADGWDTLALLRRRLADSLARVAEVGRTTSGELPPSISGALRLPPADAKAAGPSGRTRRADARPRPAIASGPVATSVALEQAIEIMRTRLPVWNAAQIAGAAHHLRGHSSEYTAGGCFRTDTCGMLRMSHAIEDVVLVHRPACEFFAGFQRLSLLTHQIQRYQAILECVRYLCLFGLDDAPDSPVLAQLQHPRAIRFVIQPRVDSGLAWYWFLAVDDPALCTVLLARQSRGDPSGRAQRSRTYDGFWSSHPPLVREIVGFLRAAGRARFYA
jgi:hypothetical protein